jgi:hypothetical protein
MIQNGNIVKIIRVMSKEVNVFLVTMSNLSIPLSQHFSFCNKFQFMFVYLTSRRLKQHKCFDGQLLIRIH